MKKVVKQYLFPVLLSMGICVVGYYFLHGIPLFGIPKTEKISYVEIHDKRLGNNARIFSETEDIEKAVKIANLLNYELGTSEQEDPFITITYHLKSGDKILVLANEETVYWKGKAFKIKGDNGTIFVKVTEGIFFFDLLIEKENVS